MAERFEAFISYSRINYLSKSGSTEYLDGYLIELRHHLSPTNGKKEEILSSNQVGKRDRYKLELEKLDRLDTREQKRWKFFGFYPIKDFGNIEDLAEVLLNLSNEQKIFINLNNSAKDPVDNQEFLRLVNTFSVNRMKMLEKNFKIEVV